MRYYEQCIHADGLTKCLNRASLNRHGWLCGRHTGILRGSFPTPYARVTRSNPDDELVKVILALEARAIKAGKRVTLKFGPLNLTYLES